MREAQAQLQARAALLQRLDQVLAGDQPLGRLLRLVIALVRARAEQFARQQAGVAFEGDTVFIARVQARQVNARVDQQGHAGMQHVGHRRIHPLHRRRRARRPIGGAVRELGTHGACVAKGCEGSANFRARERRVVAHQRAPVEGPAERQHQLARQAERQVEHAEPGAGRAQPLGEAVEGRVRVDALQPHSALRGMAERDRDRLAQRGPAGEIDAGEQGKTVRGKTVRNGRHGWRLESGGQQRRTLSGTHA